MAEINFSKYKDMATDELAKIIAGPSRLKRKNAAKILTQRVKDNPAKYKKYIPDFVDALSRPEAQTRWECLNALSMLVDVDANACGEAIEGAEEALFDEKTSLIRVSAIRFLCRYGASSKTRSKEVWFLIKEALHQFNGEIEFDEMLVFVLFFAAGNLDATIRQELQVVIDEINGSVYGPTQIRLEKIINVIKDPNYLSKDKTKKSKSIKKTKSTTKNTKKEDKNTDSVKKSASKKSVSKSEATAKATNKNKITTKKQTKKTSASKSSTKKPSTSKSK